MDGTNWYQTTGTVAAGTGADAPTNVTVEAAALYARPADDVTTPSGSPINAIAIVRGNQ